MKPRDNTRVLSEVSFNREMGLLNVYDRMKRKTRLHFKMKKCIYDSLFIQNQIQQRKTSAVRSRSLSEYNDVGS